MDFSTILGLRLVAPQPRLARRHTQQGRTDRSKVWRQALSRSLSQAVLQARNHKSSVRSLLAQVVGGLYDRWSVTPGFGKLYVRTFAQAIPVPTWARRSRARAAFARRTMRSRKPGAKDLERLISVLEMGFLVLATSFGDGRRGSPHSVSVVLDTLPQGPTDRKKSIGRSLYSILSRTPRLRALPPTDNATVVRREVEIRPCASV